ncbi:MAG: hypothetical protein WCA89_08850 [Terracidiphilus sp.]
MTNELPMAAGIHGKVELVPWKIEGEETRHARCSAEACANARLMASAPELLDALETLRKVIDDVLAKATGDAL